MLEDDSGRIRIVGDMLKTMPLVTGCIIAVMGTENASGELEVIDLKFPDLAPQPERWALGSAPNGKRKQQQEEPDTEMTNGSSSPSSQGSKQIAIVSDLSFSGSDASYALELNLLVEYLLGEALTPQAQAQVSQICRLVIAGNSIRTMNAQPEDDAAAESGAVGGSDKKNKKYGYDSSTYNPIPSQLFDEFIAELLPSMPVTLLPGEQDPANASYPQQPIHPAMFPSSRAFTSDPISKEPAWFDSVTNPWEAEVEGWRVLGTGGQNVNDVFKYVDSEDRLGMMEAMCRWRCCAPTAPDTLCKLLTIPLRSRNTNEKLTVRLGSYPFQDDDPFVMKTSPHLYFVGNQPEFGTRVIHGLDGQTVRLVTVPSFAKTKEIVLVDAETLEVTKVKIEVA